jgi:ornithine decarboxylase
MPQIEILQPQCPLTSSSPTHSGSLHFPFYDKLLSHHDLVETSPPQFRTHTDASADRVEDEIHFPTLPPLLRGHPEVHLRNGVMNAARLLADHQPDAESAFFVADLGNIYMQHQRWMRCLPEIKPFYGSPLIHVSSARDSWLGIYSREM